MITEWKRRTLRVRLAAWYGIVGTLLLSVFSATLYFYVRDRMARPLDYDLLRDLAEIERKLEVRSDGSLLWQGEELSPHSPWTRTDPWFEVWSENGELIRRLWPFRDHGVQYLPAPPEHGDRTLSLLRVSPEVRLRVLNMSHRHEGADTGLMLRVMRVHQPAADALGALRWIIFLALPIVIAMLVLGGFVVTRRWLAPLDRMAAEANRISADDLSRRLSVDDPADELGQLALVFNVTLDRLESSFSALDRFVADASHELRTPLTTLRSVGEVGLRRPRSTDEYREIIGSMLEEAQRLELLVGRLLELATAEGGAPDLRRAELQLDEFVAASVRELAILAEARGQRLVLDTVPCRVTTDRVIVRQALQNLIDNATKYSPENSSIDVVVRERDAAVEISVIDEGIGIRAEDRPQLMSRFFRPDRARDRSSGGFGLGLSITKAYMRVVGGELLYRPASPRGSTFVLVLPKN